MHRLAALPTLIAALLVHTAAAAVGAMLSGRSSRCAKIEHPLQGSPRPKTETKAGREYATINFSRRSSLRSSGQCGTCIGKTTETITPGSFLFVIGADGHVKQLLFSMEEPFAQCVAEKLEAISTLPKPPEDNWIEGTLLANHEANEPHGKNAPTDTPMRIGTDDDVTRYQKAIAPYVAKKKVRAPLTLTHAKRRFIAGLP